jgi:hypothetical protein
MLSALLCSPAKCAEPRRPGRVLRELQMHVFSDLGGGEDRVSYRTGSINSAVMPRLVTGSQLILIIH